MTTEKMNVHKALAELKVIDDRINNAIDSGTYIIANKHSNIKIQGVTIDEFKTQMKASYQKVNDLIARRNAIKRAVVLSNATTKVNIGGVDYTVAEAIEMKNHGMELKSKFMKTMVLQYNRAKRDFEDNNGEFLDRKAEQYVLAVIGAQPKDSKMAIDSEGIKNMRAQYMKDNVFDIIDPINIKDVIENLHDEIEKFLTEIDAALSVSNALTIIEVEY